MDTTHMNLDASLGGGGGSGGTDSGTVTADSRESKVASSEVTTVVTAGFADSGTEHSNFNGHSCNSDLDFRGLSRHRLYTIDSNRSYKCNYSNDGGEIQAAESTSNSYDNHNRTEISNRNPLPGPGPQISDSNNSSQCYNEWTTLSSSNNQQYIGNTSGNCSNRHTRYSESTTAAYSNCTSTSNYNLNYQGNLDKNQNSSNRESDPEPDVDSHKSSNYNNLNDSQCHNDIRIERRLSIGNYSNTKQLTSESYFRVNEPQNCNDNQTQTRNLNNSDNCSGTGYTNQNHPQINSYHSQNLTHNNSQAQQCQYNDTQSYDSNRNQIQYENSNLGTNTTSAATYVTSQYGPSHSQTQNNNQFQSTQISNQHYNQCQTQTMQSQSQGQYTSSNNTHTMSISQPSYSNTNSTVNQSQIALGNFNNSMYGSESQCYHNLDSADRKGRIQNDSSSSQAYQTNASQNYYQDNQTNSDSNHNRNWQYYTDQKNGDNMSHDSNSQQQQQQYINHQQSQSGPSQQMPQQYHYARTGNNNIQQKDSDQIYPNRNPNQDNCYHNSNGYQRQRRDNQQYDLNRTYQTTEFQPHSSPGQNSNRYSSNNRRNYSGQQQKSNSNNNYMSATVTRNNQYNPNSTVTNKSSNSQSMSKGNTSNGNGRINHNSNNQYHINSASPVILDLMYRAVKSLYNDRIYPDERTLKARIQSLQSTMIMCNNNSNTSINQISQQQSQVQTVPQSNPLTGTTTNTNDSTLLDTKNTCLLSNFIQMYTSQSQIYHVIKGDTHLSRPAAVLLRSPPTNFRGFIDPSDRQDPGFSSELWKNFEGFLEDTLKLIQTLQGKAVEAAGGGCQSQGQNQNHNDSQLQQPQALDSNSNCTNGNVVISKQEQEDLVKLVSHGRYGMATELQRRNLRFLEGLSLGEICHLVELSVQKKLLAYENNRLLPAAACASFKNAFFGRPTLSVRQDGPGVNIQWYNVELEKNSNSTNLNLTQNIQSQTDNLSSHVKAQCHNDINAQTATQQSTNQNLNQQYSNFGVATTGLSSNHGTDSNGCVNKWEALLSGTSSVINNTSSSTTYQQQQSCSGTTGTMASNSNSNSSGMISNSNSTSTVMTTSSIGNNNLYSQNSSYIDNGTLGNQQYSSTASRDYQHSSLSLNTGNYTTVTNSLVNQNQNLQCHQVYNSQQSLNNNTVDSRPGNYTYGTLNSSQTGSPEQNLNLMSPSKVQQCTSNSNIGNSFAPAIIPQTGQQISTLQQLQQQFPQESFISDMNELKSVLTHLLSSPTHMSQNGFNLSTLKSKVRNVFGKRLSETVFHQTKLLDLLTLSSLQPSIVIIEKLMGNCGYMCRPGNDIQMQSQEGQGPGNNSSSNCHGPGPGYVNSNSIIMCRGPDSAQQGSSSGVGSENNQSNQGPQAQTQNQYCYNPNLNQSNHINHNVQNDLNMNSSSNSQSNQIQYQNQNTMVPVQVLTSVSTNQTQSLNQYQNSNGCGNDMNVNGPGVLPSNSITNQYINSSGTLNQYDTKSNHNGSIVYNNSTVSLCNNHSNGMNDTTIMSNSTQCQQSIQIHQSDIIGSGPRVNHTSYNINQNQNECLSQNNPIWNNTDQIQKPQYDSQTTTPYGSPNYDYMSRSAQYQQDQQGFDCA